MPRVICEKCGKFRYMLPRQHVCDICKRANEKEGKRRRYLRAKALGIKSITSNISLSKKGVNVYIDNGRWYWECTNGLKSVEGFKTMGLCRRDAIRMLGGEDETDYGI